MLYQYHKEAWKKVWFWMNAWIGCCAFVNEQNLRFCTWIKTFGLWTNICFVIWTNIMLHFCIISIWYRNMMSIMVWEECSKWLSCFGKWTKPHSLLLYTRTNKRNLAFDQANNTNKCDVRLLCCINIARKD